MAGVLQLYLCCSTNKVLFAFWFWENEWSGSSLEHLVADLWAPEGNFSRLLLLLILYFPQYHFWFSFSCSMTGWPEAMYMSKDQEIKHVSYCSGRIVFLSTEKPILGCKLREKSPVSFSESFFCSNFRENKCVGAVLVWTNAKTITQ